MKNAKILAVLFSAAMFTITFATRAQDSTNAAAALAQNAKTNAPNAANTLNQYVADWQKESGDDPAMLEKIVKLAATITNPPPEIPEEARRHAVKGETVIKQAKEKSDFQTGADEFRQALRIAPWWADAYKALSGAAESAGDYDMAEAALKLYLASNPDDARAAQDWLYKIDAEKDLAIKHAADEQAKAQEQAKAHEPSFAGKWYAQAGNDYFIEILGSPGNYSARCQGSRTNPVANGGGLTSTTTDSISDFQINGNRMLFRMTETTMVPGVALPFIKSGDFDLTLSSDGKILSGTTLTHDYGDTQHTDNFELFRRDY